MSGSLITFEGGEGSGKSTLIEAIKKYFDEHKIDYVATREPGGLKICEEIRNILKYSTQKINPRAEFLLFSASRAELVQEYIRPCIEQGKVVLCDRFFDSSRVYQGYANNFDDAEIMSITNFATDGLVPAKTFFLDIDPVIAFRRKGGQDAGDRIEQRDIAYHQKVREGYLKIAKNDSRFVILDSTQPPEKLLQIVIETLKKESVI